MIQHLTAGFLVSRTYTRVGLVVFGTRSRVVFGLNGYRNNGGVFNALGRSIRNPQSGSKIGGALWTARKIFARYVLPLMFKGIEEFRKSVGNVSL